MNALHNIAFGIAAFAAVAVAGGVFSPAHAATCDISAVTMDEIRAAGFGGVLDQTLNKNLSAETLAKGMEYIKTRVHCGAEAAEAIIAESQAKQDRLQTTVDREKERDRLATNSPLAIKAAEANDRVKDGGLLRCPRFVHV